MALRWANRPQKVTSLVINPKIALVHLRLLERKAAVVYAARRDHLTLFLAAPDFIDDDRSRFRHVPFDEVLALDSSLADLANLAVGHCAFRSDPSEPWSYGTIPVGSTFLITYEVRPDDSNPERDRLGGAFVNCWVVTDSLDSALLISADHLSASGWVIIERTADDVATTEDFEDDPYFRQVQIDGLVCVVHTFPREELELS